MSLNCWEVDEINFKTVIKIMFFLIMIPGFIQAKEVRYSKLFPRTQVIDVKVEIEEKMLEGFYQNLAAEAYFPASVDYNGHQLNVVGIKARGNSTILNVPNIDYKQYNYRLKFDKYIKRQNLFGLTTINFNNNFGDPSYLKEFLSYQLMEDMGVPIPEFSFINLYINGELKGLYLAVQQIDQVFIDNNFEIADGDLYKSEGEGNDLLWRGNDISNYSGIKYKSKKNTDHQALLNMLDELNNGNNYREYLNVDEILRFFAVNTVLSNMDSYQGIMKHNYYLYEEKGVFLILPWKLNKSFAGFSLDEELEQLISLKIDEPTMGLLEERPLIAKLLEVPEYLEKYHYYIEKLVTTYIEPKTFKKEVTSLADFIRPYVEKDPGIFYTLEDFDESISEISTGLLGFVKERVDNVRKQLSGEIPSAGDGSGLNIKSYGEQQMSADNSAQSSPEIVADMAGIFISGNIPEENNGQIEEESEKMTAIILKYFDLISISFMLIIMLIISGLFIKRKI